MGQFTSCHPTSELEWDPSVLYHEFKQEEQLGEVPTIDSFFDEVGDYKHQIIVQHMAYFQRQDGDLLDDVIDLCVFASQTSQTIDEPVLYDACETELELS
jgi:hypothetical protein